MSKISSFFPSIFACIRPQQHSAPLRSQSFDFFNSLEYDEETGRITNHIVTTSSDKKRKSRNSFLKSSKKGKVSLASCIGTQNKGKHEFSEQRCKFTILLIYSLIYIEFYNCTKLYYKVIATGLIQFN